MTVTSDPIIRGTEPKPVLRKLRDQKNGLTLFAAKALAESEGGRLARSSEFDYFFSQIPGGVSFNAGNLCQNAWTETIVAYPKSNEPIGDSIEWIDTSTALRQYLDTKNFKGLKGVALVFDGFTFSADRSTILYHPVSEIVVVENFPQEKHSGSKDPRTGIPILSKMDFPHYPSYDLVRVDDQWVGSIVRSYSRIANPDNFDNIYYVSFKPSCTLGVFVVETTIVRN